MLLPIARLPPVMRAMGRLCSVFAVLRSDLARNLATPARSQTWQNVLARFSGRNPEIFRTGRKLQSTATFAPHAWLSGGERPEPPCAREERSGPLVLFGEPAPGRAAVPALNGGV